MTSHPAVRRGIRIATAVVAGAAGLLATTAVRAVPAGAHGVGGRQDLPLPAWQVAWGAGVAVVISFAALGLLWTRPRLDAAAVGRLGPAATRPLVTATTAVGRVVVLALFALTVAAAFFGSSSAAENLAPVAFYVAFWVGVQILAAVAGDVWSDIDPLTTLGRLLPRRGTDAEAGTGTADEMSEYPAALVLGAFAWLELAYHEPSSPRAVGIFLVAMTVFVLGGAFVRGPAWLRHANGFGVLFRLLACLSPFSRDTETGRLRVRVPGSGLATAEIRRGTLAVVLVVLGSTSFDGFSRTQFWSEVTANRTGWDRTLWQTIGLVWTIAIVAALYLGACRIVAAMTGSDTSTVADRNAAPLIPIALAYSVAHYFSLLVFEGQNFLIQLSDPFAQGWNLFGTGDWRVDYLVISATAIAWVQAGSIVAGHIAGVVAAHDRAVADHRSDLALRSQYPMLAVMVLYTVGGLLLLLGA